MNVVNGRNERMNNTSASPESPCVRNCCLNEDDICLGCFRALADITVWSQASDPLRCEILLLAEQRRTAHDEKYTR